MISSLADHLAAARRHRFVGRAAERQLFQSLLHPEQPPFFLLYLFGAGGVGKTTLLREFTYMAQAAQVVVIALDGRNVEPTPEAFLATLQQATGRGTSAAPLEVLTAGLAGQERRVALLLDTYEELAPLDAWLRSDFFPHLPDNVVVVMAGRTPPAAGWRSDPGWQAVMRVLPLRNFTPEDGQAYLAQRQTPLGDFATILEFTRGHPLALSLVADLLTQRPATQAAGSFQPAAAPDVIKSLVERFMEKVPSADHRLALEAAALVRVLTESLLQEMLAATDQEAHELFAWLRDLSFIDSDRRGLFPHDLAREALAAELHWRNPDRYAQLHQQAQRYYMAHVLQGDRDHQRRTLADYIYLHRDNPVMRAHFAWQETGTVFTDQPRPGEEQTIVNLIEQYEGQAASQLARHWLAEQPRGVTVARDAAGQLRGVLFAITLEAQLAEQSVGDPALVAAWRYLQQHAALRPGERATYFRFWLTSEAYQAISPVQSRLFLTMVQHYLTTPALAYTFLPFADPLFWRAFCAQLDLQRIQAADFTLDGRTYGVYGHDWRVAPPMQWLALMAEREQGSTTPALETPQENILVLGEAEFSAALHEALKQHTSLSALQNNLLLRTRLLLHASGGVSELAARALTLQKLLQSTAANLEKSPKTAKLLRVLHHTYFQPAPTQEAAAELLDLPFSTYRRHLVAGVAYITQQLWQQELGG